MSFRCGRHAASVMYGPRPGDWHRQDRLLSRQRAAALSKRDGVFPDRRPIGRVGSLKPWSYRTSRPARHRRGSAGWSMLRPASRLLDAPPCHRQPPRSGARLPQMRISRELIFVSTLELQGPSSNRCIENVEFRVDVVKVMTSWWNWPRACSISGPPSRRAPQSTMEPNHLA